MNEYNTTEQEDDMGYFNCLLVNEHDNRSLPCGYPHECWHCGWNPRVADERMEKIKKDGAHALVRKEEGKHE